MNNTPLSAIKAFKSCPLYPYRTGHNTNFKRTMTEEQRQMAAERLKKAREAKNST